MELYIRTIEIADLPLFSPSLGEAASFEALYQLLGAADEIEIRQVMRECHFSYFLPCKNYVTVVPYISH